MHTYNLFMTLTILIQLIKNSARLLADCSWEFNLASKRVSDHISQSIEHTKSYCSRGDYDYCRVPGTRQLSPLEVGEDNSKFEPKKLRKI